MSSIGKVMRSFGNQVMSHWQGNTVGESGNLDFIMEVDKDAGESSNLMQKSG